LEYVTALKELLPIGNPDPAMFGRIEALFRVLTPYSQPLNMLLEIVHRFEIDIPQAAIDAVIQPKSHTQALAPMIDFFVELLPVYRKFQTPSRAFVDAFFGDIVFARPDALGERAEAILAFAQQAGIGKPTLQSKIAMGLQKFCESNFLAVVRFCKAMDIRVSVLSNLKKALLTAGQSEETVNEMIQLALEVDPMTTASGSLAGELRAIAERPGVSEENRTKLKAKAAARPAGSGWSTMGPWQSSLGR
jgi:hypothetical protein